MGVGLGSGGGAGCVVPKWDFSQLAQIQNPPYCLQILDNYKAEEEGNQRIL
jgi:hypothetical protein